MTRMSGNQAEARIIVGLEGRPGGLRKLAILGLTLGALVVLAGCSGRTDRATDITSDSATLHATGRCNAGETCTWYWEYWPASSPRALSERTPVQGPHQGANADFSVSTVVTHLQSDTTYRWVLCGSPNNGAGYGCVGPHGQVGSTKADPPPDFETFTTAPPVGALSEGWDGTSWALRATPNPPGAQDSHLSGISCTSATMCTAVGSYIDGGVGGSGTEVPLAERWNGSTWTIQPTPDPPGAQDSHLSGISCTSAAACTAVGYYEDGNEDRATLVERWNGTTWKVQPIPSPPGAHTSDLTGISCTSAAVCTAVGSYTTGDSSIPATLAERWNGTSWTVQPTPNPTGSPFNGSLLNGVSCTSANACTAVGEYTNDDGTEVTLAERWNGTSWKIRPTPNPTGAPYAWLHRYLADISCTSADACTAVGANITPGPDWVPLAERWNGTSWKVQPAPVPPDAYFRSSFLEAVSCASATACTAVGYYFDDNFARQTLAEGWNGTSWAIQPTPNASSKSSRRDLAGVACTSATRCTAVGQH